MNMISAIIAARKNKGKYIIIDSNGIDTTAIKYTGNGLFMWLSETFDTDGQGLHQREYETTQNYLLSSK